MRIQKTRSLRVAIKTFKTLTLYNPNGSERPVIRGKVLLEGYVKKIGGNEWVLFPTQRHFGLPLKRKIGVDERIELDLEEAAFFGDIEFERTETPAEGTAQ
jgi:hypothetical protein